MRSVQQNQEEYVMQVSKTDESVEYFNYLRKRSTLARLYRKYWLYPRLCRHLSGHVLDVGCGIGDLLAFRKGTVGTDINPRAITWCRANGHNAEAMMPDILPFENGTFDGLVLDNVLEHITDPAPLLLEAYRVLRPRGHVLIGVPGRRGYASDTDHKVFYDENLLISTMTKAGFTLQRLFPMPFKSSWLNADMRQYCLYGMFLRD